MDSKVCTKCGVEKPLDGFYIDRGKPSGQCKECRRETARMWSALNAETKAASTRSWYLRNKGRCRVASLKWVDRNKAYNAERRRNSAARARTEISDSYAAFCLGVSLAAAPADLIELKRQQLLLGRALREAKSLTKESEDDQAK